MIDLSNNRQPTCYIARSLPDEDRYHAIAASFHQTGKHLQEDPSTRGSESLSVYTWSLRRATPAVLFVGEVSTVVESVTLPAARDTPATGTFELIRSTACRAHTHDIIFSACLKIKMT